MTRTEYQIVYPDGEAQEISRRLRINELVDVNGNPLRLPLPSAMMIVYRVYRMSTDTEIGLETVSFHLEQLSRAELEELTG